MRPRAHAGAVLIAILLFAACSDQARDLLSPSASLSPTATIEALRGDEQVGPANATLTNALSIRIMDGGSPVAGVRGTITVTAGGGSTNKATFRTSRAGRSSFTWTLGATGPQVVTVSVDGGGPTVQFTATVIPVGSTLSVVPTSNNQSGTAGDTLATNIFVELLDPLGNPIAGVPVSFAVDADVGGGVRYASRRTAANGRALNRWALGWGAVTQNLTATVAGVGSTQVTATAAAPAGHELQIFAGNNQSAGPGQPLPNQLSIVVVGPGGIRVPDANGTWAVTAGGGSLNRSTFATGGTGRANASWTLGAGGTQQVTATIPVLGSVTFNATVVGGTSCTGAGAVTLDFDLGETVRFQANDPSVPRCIFYDHAANAGQQYLILAENAPATGLSSDGHFPGTTLAGPFTISVTAPAAGAGIAAGITVPRREFRVGFDEVLPRGMSHAWETPAGPIYEFDPGPMPAADAARGPMIRRNGRNEPVGAAAVFNPGDTVQVFLSGLPHVPGHTANAWQWAMVKYVSNDIVFLEDLRLRRRQIWRQNADLSITHNDTLSLATLASIATEYAAYGKVQGDLMFDGRHNAAAEQVGRVLAVHTYMPSNGVWGYTYSLIEQFTFDYWVGTNGTTPSYSQDPRVVADQLFSHEIAHMMHWGVLERAGRATQAERGHTWLVEGFAAHIERSGIAARLMGTQSFSRSGNATLGFYPGFGVYYFADVPTYLNAGSGMFGGYAASSHVFDYFADQIAGSHDWRAKLREMLVAGGNKAEFDALVNTYLPGNDFASLFTRSRVALYMDDYAPGLPAHTQFLMYNLRASRPPSSQAPNDPRNLWPKILPGTAFNVGGTLSTGGGYGFLIDGTQATASTDITVTPALVQRGAISITRVK